ncbi:MAG: 4-hydroxybenzoate octaprenyltransferase [Pseudomonadota bacterium]
MTLRPYLTLMRLDKPIGIWLLFFPAAWAVAFTAPHPAPLMLLMLIGALLTRAAGCIINDLTDRRLDAQVERTRHRPLASGALSVRAALILLAVLLILALGIALLLPPRVFLLALLALPMIAAYPWMKRITWWPQLFLGLTFNLGALFGWLASGAPLSWPAFTLYAAGIFWTLGYDTIYAVQDMADDARVGIRSSARAVGRWLKPFVAVCYLLTLTLLAVTGYGMHTGLAYPAALLVAAAHALWQIRQLPCDPARAGMIFRSNQWFGLIVLLGLLFGRFI